MNTGLSLEYIMEYEDQNKSPNIINEDKILLYIASLD